MTVPADPELSGSVVARSQLREGPRVLAPDNAFVSSQVVGCVGDHGLGTRGFGAFARARGLGASPAHAGASWASLALNSTSHIASSP